MSLSVTLIPIAVGAISVATTATVGAVSEKINEKINESVHAEAMQGSYHWIDTVMKDEEILAQALKNYGCEVKLNRNVFQSSLGDFQLGFQMQEDGTFSAVVHDHVDLRDAEEFIENIQNEYTRIVQRNTYEKLLQRAKQEGLLLETENTTEDGTIVLTFNVEEHN